MTLYAIKLASLVVLIISLVCSLTVLLMIIRNRNRKPTNQSKSMYRSLICILCVVYALSGLLFSISVYFSHKAIKYGAFGNFEEVETISSVLKNTDKGFIESDNIPEDLHGSIIIYFKYGCPDCSGIHDALLQAVASHPDNKIYFVSSRSEFGKELLKTYGVDAVPSGIYIPKNSTDLYHIEVLYNLDHKPGEPVIFMSENFETLINMQNADNAVTEGES